MSRFITLYRSWFSIVWYSIPTKILGFAFPSLHIFKTSKKTSSDEWCSFILLTVFYYIYTLYITHPKNYSVTFCELQSYKIIFCMCILERLNQDPNRCRDSSLLSRSTFISNPSYCSRLLSSFERSGAISHPHLAFPNQWSPLIFWKHTRTNNLPDLYSFFGLSWNIQYPSLYVSYRY